MPPQPRKCPRGILSGFASDGDDGSWGRPPAGAPASSDLASVALRHSAVHRLCRHPDLPALDPQLSRPLCPRPVGGDVSRLFRTSPFPQAQPDPGVRRICRKSLKVHRSQSRRNPPEVGFPVNRSHVQGKCGRKTAESDGRHDRTWRESELNSVQTRFPHKRWARPIRKP